MGFTYLPPCFLFPTSAFYLHGGTLTLNRQRDTKKIAQKMSFRGLRFALNVQKSHKWRIREIGLRFNASISHPGEEMVASIILICCRCNPEVFGDSVT